MNRAGARPAPGSRKTGTVQPPRAPPPFRRLKGRTAQATAGLVILHVLLCAALFEPKIHTGGDSVTYVLLAESLFTPGDGYALSIGPGPPQAHTKYPPGYPAMLAPLVAAFGRNFVVLKLLSLVFTAGAVLVFCRYALRGREPLPWFVLALAFAVSPGVIDYSRWMLSEAPFLFFTLLALRQLDEDRTGEAMGRPFWLGLAAAVTGFYVRSIGALLLAAASLSYLARREWRKFFVHGAVGAGLTIPWLVRNRLASDSATPYLEEFLLSNVYEPEAGYLGLGGMVERFFENAVLYGTRELPRALAGSDSTWAGAPPVVLIAAMVCGLVLFGLVRALRRGPAAAEFYFILTCAAIMLFQTSVNDVRYLVPLIPLVLIYASDASATLARTSRGFLPPLLPAFVTGALAVLALGAQGARIPANVDMIARYHAGDRYAGYHPAWGTFFDAAAWVKSNTPADAVVTVRKPRLYHALTGRRALIYPFSSDPDSVLEFVRNTDYVVIDAISPTTSRYLVPALQRETDDFYLAHQTREPSTLVLGVRDAARPPNP